MALNESDLYNGLISLPVTYLTSAEYANAFASVYQTYANMCVTGLPASAAIVPGSAVPNNLALKFSTLTPQSTPEDCAKAYADGIKAYWLTAQFSTASVSASILLPPTEVLVKLPKNRAIEAASDSISKHVDAIVKDLESMPSALTAAAAGASSAQISDASTALKTNIDSISASLSSITEALGNIPTQITGSSDMPKIGQAFSDIGSGVSSAGSAVTAMISTISGFPSILGAAVTASVSSALTPITDDISKQFQNITGSASAGIANMTAPSMQTISLETALVKGFLCNTNNSRELQIKTLAKILHACTKTGTTSVVDMTTGIPVNSIGVLGDPTDTAGIDLSS